MYIYPASKYKSRNLIIWFILAGFLSWSGHFLSFPAVKESDYTIGMLSLHFDVVLSVCNRVLALFHVPRRSRAATHFSGRIVSCRNRAAKAIAVLPTVPTAHYMVNGARIFNPYLAWHATNMIIFCSAVKQLV